MLPPYTGTSSNNSSTSRDSNFQSPPSLSSIYDTPFGESWTKNTCVDHGSNSKSLEYGSFDGVVEKGSPYYDPAFGSVPSSWEVERALSDLQSFMSGCYVPKEEMNWRRSMLMKSPGNARYYDAYHMFQNEPSIQRLVCSIACDRAVWEAMMRNKEVQNLKDSLICAAKEEESLRSTRESDIGSLIVKWIMEIITTRIAELIQSFGSLLSDMIHNILESDNKEKPTSELTDLLEEKIRSSFLLSVVLVLIVVVTRTQGV